MRKKKMKAKDIKSLSLEDLKKKTEEAKKELMKQNAQIATGTTPTSPGQVRNLKKTVARLANELKNKESKQ